MTPTGLLLLKTIIYISRARDMQAAQHLRDFLPGTRARNAERSITGVLLFDGEHYFQILEGPSAELFVLLKKIEADLRHTEFKVLAERAVTQRTFAEFSMGYLYDPSFAIENATFLCQDIVTEVAVHKRSMELTAAADRFS